MRLFKLAQPLLSLCLSSSDARAAVADDAAHATTLPQVLRAPARPASAEHQALLEVATAAAREAGAQLRAAFVQPIETSYKGRIDPVTGADAAAQATVLARIRASYPEHGILAEEDGGTRATAALVRWVVDPIDGTTNFLRHNPHFSVLIGVQARAHAAAPFVTQVAVVYDPMRDELFSAVRGAGARLNGSRIAVSAAATLGRSLAGTDFTYTRLTERDSNHAEYTRMSLVTQGVRVTGSAGLDLAWLAAGRIDAFWHHGLKPWDMAAGALIIEEAGGEVTDLFGGAFDVEAPSILASNGKQHQVWRDELLRARELPMGSRRGLEAHVPAALHGQLQRLGPDAAQQR